MARKPAYIDTETKALYATDTISKADIEPINQADVGLDQVRNVASPSQEFTDTQLAQLQSAIEQLDQIKLEEVNWGDIGGDIVDQSDLQTELDGKADADDLLQHVSDTDNPHETIEDKYFQYSQATPSALWNITHNLNKNPSVTVTDSAGTVVEGEIRYINPNELEIEFSAGFSGQAELN